MKSPFPGMDPYIEACGLWEDFHNHLIEDIYRSIARVLPRGYFASSAVRSYVVLVESEGKDESSAQPDVTITQPVGKKPRKPKGDLAVAEPVVDADSVPMRAFIAEEFEEKFVEIYALGEERVLVTCVEVLSPSNKRPETEGWEQYLRKRQAMLLGKANFIEIDLLRGGGKMPMLTPWPDSPYTLLVSRMRRPTHARVWKGYFDRPLPRIPVPLLSSDPDLTLDLQPLIEDIYSLARYDEQIDYDRRLKPALSSADAAVVRKLLKDRPRR
ncbi:MAG TPA: DUF4058 family protein [Gemmataceae bacterium]|nr:DUF4058 family protein [Gemmataceae bacterium]